MSTENSRADALTYRMTEFDVLLDGYQEALQDGPPKERADARNELRLAYRTALLAAAPVEQPASAPIDSDHRKPITSLRGLREEAARLSATMFREMLREVLAEAIEALSAPAPSPADERAAPCNIVSHPDERVSMTITQYAELQRASAMLDWLEHQIRQRGMQGVSFDWVPSVDGEPSGYRYMRRHFIAEPKKTLRDAIDEAQRSEK